MVKMKPQIILNKIEGQISMIEIFQECDENHPIKRRKSRYGYLNMAHFSFYEAGICSFCDLTFNSDDDEYNPNTECEEERLMGEKKWNLKNYFQLFLKLYLHRKIGFTP